MPAGSDGGASNNLYCACGIERPSRERSLDGCRQAALQCAQMPEISITGVFGEKPAAREADLIVSATAALAASPTAPHVSQIRNTTGSPLSWLCTQAIKELRL